MGIISNFTIYALMVLPIAMMIRGHAIYFSRTIKLTLLCVVLQLAESLLIGAAPGSATLTTVVHGLIMPLVQAAFFSFILHDNKAMKALKLREAGDGDTAAVVATVWCLTYTVLYRWISWYHTMNSLGYEVVTVLSAAEAFLSLVGSLAAARRIGGVPDEGAAPVSPVSLVAVGASALAGTAASLALPAVPLAGAVVSAALLVLMPKKTNDAKKQH